MIHDNNTNAFETDCRDQGIWLDLFCPDDSCLRDEERINIPVFCSTPETVKDLWPDTFCPDSSCEIIEATNLP